MAYKTKIISYDARIKVFWVLTSICIISLSVYIYAVNMTIRNTALRQGLETEVARLSVEQSNLEFARIQKSQGINIEMAYARGLHNASEPIYISRGSAGTLSYNTQNN